uniref:Uncharacterized protein n=1 Tax=Romanomermis culicivorax TaxID=13658 RepID=A0A915J251_ROMCU
MNRYSLSGYDGSLYVFRNINLQMFIICRSSHYDVEKTTTIKKTAEKQFMKYNLGASRRSLNYSICCGLA